MSRRAIPTCVVLLAVLLVAAAVSAQVPTVIKFSGVLTGGSGARTVSATFSVYGDPKSDTPLWQETQSIAVDADGRYAVLLGATAPDGVPPAIFTTGEARWVGVTIDGDEAGQLRVALASVPYALKAEDATTIGGRPLSAFVLAGDRTGVGADGLTYVDARGLRSGLTPPSPQSGYGAATSLIGANFLARFSDSLDLTNSALYQATTGRVGVNTVAPQAPFHVVASETPGSFFDVYSGSGVLGALPVVHRAARGTDTSPMAVQADDILGGLAVRAYNGSTFTGGRGQVMFKAAENWTTTANGTYLAFATESLGASTQAVERMRIAADGKVGVGTTAPGQALTVAGIIESVGGLGGFKFPDGSVQSMAAGPAGIASSKNTVTGKGAGGAFGSNNSAYGADSLAAAGVGSVGNSAFGSGSLTSNTGDLNSAFGVGSLRSNTTGNYNSAFGWASLRDATTASDNTAVGYWSAALNTTGARNTALGSGTSAANDAGSDNTTVGYQALSANEGSYNTVVGAEAAGLATGTTWTTAVGFQALDGLTTGDANSAVGRHAGGTTTTGSYNSFFGFGAGASAGDVSFSTAIGVNAEVGQDHALVLGGTGLAFVDVGIGTGTPDERLQVVGDIKIGVNSSGPGCVKNYAGTQIAGACSSDLRLKTDIRPFGSVLDKVAQLQPVHYTWRASEFPTYHFGDGVNAGLIAQDVERLFPELVSTDEHGFKAVNYSELPLLAIAAVKELKAENDALGTRNRALERQLRAETDALKVRNATLESKLDALTDRLAKLEQK
jgi:hypothetical protein